jgi:hypothetical protein
MAKHHREQPEHLHGSRLVGERDAELGKINLGLPAGSGLEPAFEWLDASRPFGAQVVGHGTVAAAIPHCPDLAQEPFSRQVRVERDPLQKVGFEGGELSRTFGPRLVCRRLDTSAKCLRTVLRSRPVLRAIADTDRPCRCRSWIITTSSSLTTQSLPPNPRGHRVACEDRC